MNEDLKKIAIETVGTVAMTFGITVTAYISFRIAQKAYGPIEVKHKN